MPTYEYSCPGCGTYDVEQRITEKPLATCQKCGGPVKRLISRSSFALRGGGWYADGYASGAAAKGACGGPACGGGACGKAEA